MFTSTVTVSELDALADASHDQLLESLRLALKFAGERARAWRLRLTIRPVIYTRVQLTARDLRAIPESWWRKPSPVFAFSDDLWFTADGKIINSRGLTVDLNRLDDYSLAELAISLSKIHQP